MTATLGTRHDHGATVRGDEAGRRSAATAAVVVTLAAALTAVTLIRSGAAPDTDSTGLAPAAAGTDSAAPPIGTLAATTAPAPRVPLAESAPVGLSIPALGLDTDAVIELRRTASGTVEVPSHAGSVGWLVNTAAPGSRGAAVFTGHATYASQRGAFARLDSLRPGDTVTVRRETTPNAVFNVYRVERIARHIALERATAPTSNAELRLLTATGGHRPTGGESTVLVWARLTSTG